MHLLARRSFKTEEDKLRDHFKRVKYANAATLRATIPRAGGPTSCRDGIVYVSFGA